MFAAPPLIDTEIYARLPDELRIADTPTAWWAASAFVSRGTVFRPRWQSVLRRRLSRTPLQDKPGWPMAGLRKLCRQPERTQDSPRRPHLCGGSSPGLAVL